MAPYSVVADIEEKRLFLAAIRFVLWRTRSFQRFHSIIIVSHYSVNNESNCVFICACLILLLDFSRELLAR